MTGKAIQILDAARSAFFEKGYEAVTMDEVASQAGVVKQTLYSYHKNKEALFSAVYKNECQAIGQLLKISRSEVAEDAAALLSTIGHNCLETLLSPSFRTLSRVTIAATLRFPNIGRSVYDDTIQPFIHQLAEIVKEAMDRGLLRPDDPLDAALQFTALLRGELFFHCLFDPEFKPSKSARARQVTKAVDCFLAKHGTAAAR